MLGAKLDVSIAQAQAAMDFASQSIEAGNLTAAVQTMSLVESVADMALSAVPIQQHLICLEFHLMIFHLMKWQHYQVLLAHGVGKVMAVQNGWANGSSRTSWF